MSNRFLHETNGYDEAWLYMTRNNKMSEWKLGIWRRSFGMLANRYKTPYGANMELRAFRCNLVDDVRLLELAAFEVLKEYRTHPRYELFSIEGDDAEWRTDMFDKTLHLIAGALTPPPSDAHQVNGWFSRLSVVDQGERREYEFPVHVESENSGSDSERTTSPPRSEADSNNAAAAARRRFIEESAIAEEVKYPRCAVMLSDDDAKHLHDGDLSAERLNGDGMTEMALKAALDNPNVKAQLLHIHDMASRYHVTASEMDAEFYHKYVGTFVPERKKQEVVNRCYAMQRMHLEVHCGVLQADEKVAIALQWLKHRKFYQPAIEVGSLLFKMDGQWARKVLERGELLVDKQTIASSMRAWLEELDDEKFMGLHKVMGLPCDARYQSSSRSGLIACCDVVLSSTEGDDEGKKDNPMTPVTATMKKMLAGAFGMKVGKVVGNSRRRKWPLEYGMYTALVDKYGAGCMKPIERGVDWFNVEFVAVDGEEADELEAGVERGPGAE
jgi:hypothetical protein